MLSRPQPVDQQEQEGLPGEEEVVRGMRALRRVRVGLLRSVAPPWKVLGVVVLSWGRENSSR